MYTELVDVKLLTVIIVVVVFVVFFIASSVSYIK